MTTSPAVSPVECLHDTEPVLGVDAQQFQDHESNGPPLGGGAGFGAFPQLKIDPAQGVGRHGYTVWRTNQPRATQATRRLSIGCIDCSEVAS